MSRLEASESRRASRRASRLASRPPGCYQPDAMPLKKGQKLVQNLGGYYTSPALANLRKRRPAPDSVDGSEDKENASILQLWMQGRLSYADSDAKRVRTSEPSETTAGSHFSNTLDPYPYAPVNTNIHEHLEASLLAT